jgi:ankyrin repeat protein
MKNALPAIFILLAIIGALMITNLITGFALIRERALNKARMTPRVESIAESDATNSLTPTDGQFATATQSNLAFRLARTTDPRLLSAMLDEHPEFLNAALGRGQATALHIAVFNGRRPVVQELLRRNADVNVRNSAGQTPLHDCVNGARIEIARMLLEHGADLTLRNNAGQTPLQYAIEKNRPNMAEFLRQHGAKE